MHDEMFTTLTDGLFKSCPFSNLGWNACEIPIGSGISIIMRNDMCKRSMGVQCRKKSEQGERVMYPVFMAGTTGIGTNDNAKRTNTEENMIRDWGEGVEEREHDNSPEI